jgi:ABC-type spermidine/putrescine transport system permease subunit I
LTAHAPTIPFTSRLQNSAFLQAWPIYPLILFLCAFFVFPVAQLLLLSFQGEGGSFSLASYGKTIATPVYTSVLLETFKIAGWTALCSILAAYPVSYVLATARTSVRRAMLYFVLLPFWTSFLVRTFAWMILLGRDGAINKLLLTLGFEEAPLSLLHNMTGVMIGMIHSMVPLAILTMTPVLLNIDRNLVNAASTLGARASNSFWRVFFPLSLPGVAAAALLVFVTSLGFFITPALLGGPQQTMITQVIITIMQELMNWGLAGALAVVLFVAAGGVFYLYDRLIGLDTLSGGAGTGVPTKSLVKFDKPRDTVRRLGLRSLWLAGNVGSKIGEIWETYIATRIGISRKVTTRMLIVSISVLILVYLCAPSFIVIPVSFTGRSFVEFPPAGFSFKWYQTYLQSPIWIGATLRSVSVAAVTAVFSIVIGTAAAFALTRARITGRYALFMLILAPLLIPRIIIGVALFYHFSKLGLVGTFTGLVIGHTVVAAPYVVITVMAVLQAYDIRLDHAAWTLGANRWKTLYYVTLPQIRPGLIAAFLFAFITSFDDLTISLFITGGAMVTLPRQMWSDLLLIITPTLAAVSTVVLIAMSLFIGVAELMRRRAMEYR